MKASHQKPFKPDYAISIARDLRKNATAAEKVLWEHLRAKRLNGLKFRRQAPFGRYIMDFYCKARSLCIEIDGSSHHGKEEYDAERTSYLESAGIKVLHFTNQEVLQDIDGVLGIISGKVN
jgi:very-short-patch-repair endonuclease